MHSLEKDSWVVVSYWSIEMALDKDFLETVSYKTEKKTDWICYW